MLWKFVLVNSKDLSHIGELSQAHDKKLDVILSKPGSASFSYPMNADYAALIQPYNTGIKAMRFNRDASAAAGKSVWDTHWSGYVLPIDEQVGGNRMNVSCVGWLQRLGKRFMRRQKIYVAQDDGAIVGDLIAEMNLTTSPETVPYPIPVVAGSTPNTPTWLSWGGTQPNEGVGGATAYKPLTDASINAARNKTIAIYTNALSSIDELVNVENGGDIVVDPLTRAVTWHRRYRRIKDDVTFGFQWGPRNISDFGRNLEADSKINYIVGTGAPGVVAQYADNKPDQALNGLIEESVALPDIREATSLLAYVGAEQIIRANGRVTYSIVPFAAQELHAGNVPDAFIDFRVGDQVRLTAVHPPRVNIRGQAIRIFGMSITIDDNGVARLAALQVAP